MRKSLVFVAASLSLWGTKVLAGSTVQKSYTLNLGNTQYLNADPKILYLGQLLQAQYGLSISGLALQQVVLVAKSENGGGTAALMINGTSVAKATVPGTAANFGGTAADTFYSVTLKNTNPSGDNSWQIDLDGNLVVSSATLTVNVPTTTSSYTGWPLSFIGTDLTSAYPNIQYYSRFAVTGGSYPYTFKLLQAPSGMQIQTRTGEIKWTPTQNNTSANVEVEVTDSSGLTATHSFTISVTTNNFYFINAVTGNDSNTGAYGHAFKTLLGVQSKGLPMTATLYFRAGTYASTGIKMNEMPGLWMAYPGDTMPVLDCQGQRTCIGFNGLIKYPTLFQGLNFTNVEYEYFGMSGNTYPVTLRNNVMNDLVVTNPTDSAGNPAFIFTYASNPPLPTPPAEPASEYQHLIIQNNQFYDLQDSYAARASAFTWFDVSHSLVEDNVIHNVQGACLEDKDDGWFNTFRANVCYDISAYGIDILAQRTSSQEEIDHNLYIGLKGSGSNAVQIDLAVGYIANVYVHNNTFVNGSINFGADVMNANSKNFVIENNIFDDDGTGTLPSFYGVDGDINPSALPAQQTTINNNIYWSQSATLPFVIWNYQVDKTSQATWLSFGFDLDSLFTEPTLLTNGTNTLSDYSLSPTSSDYGVYGKDFSAGTWQ